MSSKMNTVTPSVGTQMMSTPAATTPVSRVLVARNEAARLLSISPRSVGFLVKDGRLPSVRVGSRSLIHMGDLHNFAATGTQKRIRPR